MRARSLAALALVALVLACAGQHAGDAQVGALRAEAWQRDVSWLAEPAREGRGLATRGLDESAEWLARAFADAGLEPGGDSGSYFQGFEAPVSIAVSRASLALSGAALTREGDFSPLLESESGALPSEVVFVGYGVSDERSGWNDYAGVEVGGRSVLALDGTPAIEPFAAAGGAAFARRAYKLLNARSHGARAVLLAPARSDAASRGPGDPHGALPTLASAGVVAIELGRDAAQRIVRAGGADLAALEREIAAAKAPRSRPLLGVRLEGSVEVKRVSGRVRNVIGVLPGNDPALGREAIVIGAHYDHLGRGEFGSLRPERRGEIHPGADDNASGAAGLAALARAFAAAPRLRRTLIFVGFTGEEAGLLGSGHYVTQPRVALADTALMINLDMIGRLGDRALTVFGTDTGNGLDAVVREAAERAGVKLSLAPSGGFGPSDHASFTAKGIPTLFFFTGAHDAYHTPDDVAAKVDPAGAVRVLDVVARSVASLADADERPAFVGEKARHGGQAPPSGGGYGPYLGTIPAFGGEPVRGVRLAAVRTGSPAEKAGLRAGDVIVAFGEAEITSLEDLAALLFTRREGDTVAIEVLRDDARIAVKAVLGRRR